MPPERSHVDNSSLSLDEGTTESPTVQPELTAVKSDASTVDLPDKRTGSIGEEANTDSGWAWVVLLGAFLVNFTGIGSIASLGVFLNVWMESFDASAASVSLVVALSSLMRGLLSKFRSIFICPQSIKDHEDQLINQNNLFSACTHIKKICLKSL